MAEEFIGDLHIHSHYSRATSKQLAPEYLDLWARIKGVRVVGTGDFTHPGWISEMTEKFEPAEPGLFRLKSSLRIPHAIDNHERAFAETRFVLSVEISNIYKKDGRVRKVHNVVVAPSLDAALAIRNRLERMGFNLKADGRPILGMDSRDLLELCLDCAPDVLFIPAHIWTPWFSVLGSKSGFDTVDECFGDLASHISAVETGLSSDPPLNWMCSFLDKYTLLANSDAHSPDKLGRNANIFSCELSYNGMLNAIKSGHPELFRGTIDMYPQEGKYHYDGHRKCGVCFDPVQTIENKGVCPECGKPLTIGVTNRIAELADRDNIEDRPNRLPFHYVIPLRELIAEAHQTGQTSKKVSLTYDKMIATLGPELEILLKTPLETIRRQGGELMAEAVERMRQGKVFIEEGYDGEYGVIKVFSPGELSHYKSNNTLFGNITGQEPLPRQLLNFDVARYRRLASDSQRQGQSRSESGVSGLNKEQLAAVQHGKGPALILAGPGTGKTHVVISRIAYLLDKQIASPNSILALTFTNKAAREMQERLVRMHGAEIASQLSVTTFHALGWKLLSERHSGNSPLLIIDEDDKALIASHLFGLPLREARRVLTSFSLCKQTGKSLSKEENAQFAGYNDYLSEYGLLDLDDMVYRLLDVLETEPEALMRLREQFTWVFVDEYQDVNASQYKLLRLLCPDNLSNLTVIGDPNQAIYGFRGADVRYIRQFANDYPEAAIYNLRRSYRCSDRILKASGYMLGLDELSFVAGMEKGLKIKTVSVPTDRSEAEFIARKIEEMIGGLRFFSMDSNVSSGHKHEGIESLSDFAVLCRTSAQMKQIAAALQQHSIPYTQATPDPLFSSGPMKELLDALYVVFMPSHPFAEWRLQQRRLALSDTDLSACRALTIPEAIEYLSEKLSLARSGYERELDQAKELAKTYGVDFQSFYEVVRLRKHVDLLSYEKESVSLLTLHASKGLEFECVFIAGCEEGLIPFSLYPELETDEAEEQRLLYVGMTRARKQLFLLSAAKREMNGRMFELERSRFLGQIERELLESVNPEGKSRKKGTDDTQLSLF